MRHASFCRVIFLVSLLASTAAMAQRYPTVTPKTPGTPGTPKAQHKPAASRTYVSLIPYDFGLNLDEYVGSVRGALMGQMAGARWAQALQETKPGASPVSLEQVPAWQNAWLEQGAGNILLNMQVPLFAAMNSQGVRVTEVSRYLAQVPGALMPGAAMARLLAQQGMPAPYSGTLEHNPYAQDASFMAMAPTIGLVCPGLPTAAQEISWRLGHAVAYGDGVSAGTYVAALYSHAFLTKNPREVVTLALTSLPRKARIRQHLEAVIALYRADTANWQGAAQRLQTLANGNPLQLEIGSTTLAFLYGQGDPKRSILLALAMAPQSRVAAACVGGLVGTLVQRKGMETFGEFPDGKLRLGASDVTLLEYEAGLRTLMAEVVDRKLGYGRARGAARRIVIPMDTAQPLLLEQTATPVAKPLTVSIRQVQQDNYRITLQAETKAASQNVHWFLGDLNTKAGKTIEHVYGSGGAHNVICYVSDDQGNTAWASATVYPGWERVKKTSLALPQVAFTTADTKAAVAQVTTLPFTLTDPTKAVARLVVFHNGDSLTTLPATARQISLTIRKPGLHCLTIKAYNQFREVLTTAFTWRQASLAIGRVNKDDNPLTDTTLWRNVVSYELGYPIGGVTNGKSEALPRVKLLMSEGSLYARITAPHPGKGLPKTDSLPTGTGDWLARKKGSLFISGEFLEKRAAIVTIEAQDGVPLTQPDGRSGGAEHRLLYLGETYDLIVRVPTTALWMANGPSQQLNIMVGTSKTSAIGYSLFPTVSATPSVKEMGLVSVEK